MRPHILYAAKDGTLWIAGRVGDIPIARVPVGQIKDLLISARHFQPDPPFNFRDPEHHHPIATVSGV
jgi:hypothetical protein